MRGVLVEKACDIVLKLFDIGLEINQRLHSRRFVVMLPYHLRPFNDGENHLRHHIVVAFEDFGNLVRHPLLDHWQIDLLHVNFLVEDVWILGHTHGARICASLERRRHVVEVKKGTSGRSRGEDAARTHKSLLPEQVGGGVWKVEVEVGDGRWMLLGV